MTIAQAPGPSRLVDDLTPHDFERFKTICERNESQRIDDSGDQKTDPAAYPLATDVVQNLVVYDAASILPLIQRSASDRYVVMDEIQRALLTGPGVCVMRNMYPTELIDRVQEIAMKVNPRTDKADGKPSRRGFAFIEKHAKADPESFADYYSNEVLSAVSEGWLGPSYQMSGSLNGTFLGGEQQPIHRDYHVSHQPVEQIRKFPLAKQTASQFLILQWAIAHTDMPMETGPTRFMPYSQTFDKGYIAVQEQEYVEYVAPRMSQLELKKGDGVFFNPATFHQPGINTTDRERVANLLQVNSAFGRAMECCDRLTMTKDLWPTIKRWYTQIQAEQSSKTEAQFTALIASVCSDYPYPKFMDMHLYGGPDTQAKLVREALQKGWEDEVVFKALDDFQAWHQA